MTMQGVELSWEGVGRFLELGIEIGTTRITVGAVLSAVFVLALAVWLARVFERAAERGLRVARSDARTVAVAGRIVHYAVLVVGVGLAFETLGFDLTTLFAAGAVVAVAVGFAAQDVLQNFFSGIILLTEGAIKPGDVLEVEGEVVRVTRMGIRSTVVRTRDEEDVILPNNMLAQSAVKNYTMQDTVFRLRTRVGVTYGSDMKLVRQTLEAAGASLPTRRADRDPAIFMAEFGDSSVVFEVSVWVDDPWATLATRSALNEKIWWALKEAGITIAFPQLDVHLDPNVVERLGSTLAD